MKDEKDQSRFILHPSSFILSKLTLTLPANRRETNTKYVVVRAKAIGHQIAAYASELGPAATSKAVSEFSGASVECNTTGKIAAARVANRPASSMLEPMNASVSCRVASPATSAIAAAQTRSNPSHQYGF